MKRAAGGLCMVVGVGVAVFGIGLIMNDENGGPFTMAIGAMLFTLGFLLWKR